MKLKPDKVLRDRLLHWSIEVHPENHTCSFCETSLWPVLKLPRCKTRFSWTHLALPWVRRRRLYIRVCGLWDWRPSCNSAHLKRT